MAYYSRAYYPADGGGDTDFQVPFQYISQRHVVVYYKNSDETSYLATLEEGVDFAWSSASMITLTDPRPAERDLLIQRQTPTTVLAKFQASVISSAKLNLVTLQRQYVDEEVSDEFQGVSTLVAGFDLRLSAVESLAGLPVAQGLRIPTSEALGAGDFINIHFASGPRVRKASAADPAKYAMGFVSVAGGVGEQVPVNTNGLNLAVAPPTLAEVFLSGTVAGGYTYTVPSADGSIIQPLGLAIPGKGILFSPQQRITL